VALTSLLGIPFARLRAALPDELLSWDLSTAMGRAHLFSKKGMDASLAKHRELIPSLFVCCTGSSVKDADDAEQDAEDKTLSSEEDAQLEELVGACLRTWCSQTATCRVLCRALTLPRSNRRHGDCVGFFASRGAYARDRAGCTHLCREAALCRLRDARWLGLCEDADRLCDAAVAWCACARTWTPRLLHVR
jgi:hypothetical protein